MLHRGAYHLIMTVDASRSALTMRRRYGRYLTAAVVIAVMVTPCRAAYAAATTTTGGPIAMTFEGGETATVPADDTIYLTEEVAAWNGTAAAAGDYAYEDYDSSTDAQTPRAHRGHNASRPDEYVRVNNYGDVKPAATIIVVPPSPTTTTLPPATTVTAFSPAATVTSATTIAAPVISDTTAPSIAASGNTTATSNVADSASVTVAPSIVASVSTTATPSIVTSANTSVAPSTVALGSTTESGVLMQIASPPAYDSTSTTSTSTTPMPSVSSVVLGNSGLLLVLVTAAIAASVFM